MDKPCEKIKPEKVNKKWCTKLLMNPFVMYLLGGFCFFSNSYLLKSDKNIGFCSIINLGLCEAGDILM